MAEEAARAVIQGADMVEVRSDRLYLTKPQATVVEDEDGNKTSTMPPVTEWAAADASDLMWQNHSFERRISTGDFRCSFRS